MEPITHYSLAEFRKVLIMGLAIGVIISVGLNDMRSIIIFLITLIVVFSWTLMENKNLEKLGYITRK